MQFVLFKYAGSISTEKKKQIKEAFNERTSIVCSHNDFQWTSKPNNCFFLGRNPNLEIYDKYNTFFIDDSNRLSFIHGWIKKENEDKLLPAQSINEISNSDNLDGFFIAGDIDGRGNGEFFCSAMFPNLYYAQSENAFAISNRISILSEIFDYKEPNKKHISSHIQYQHGPLTYETCYHNIFWIPYGTKIKINKYELEFNKKYDLFYDERLNNLYHENKLKYWDELYEKIKSQVNAFINLGIADKLTLGLSGGVDSRLILSIYYKHLDSVFSWGPAYSPEVIISKMVADELNINHITPSLRSVSNPINLLKLLPKHLFTREFEMCPWDFGWVQNNTNETIKLDGQEYLRVPPYLNDNITIEQILSEEYNNYEKKQDAGVIFDNYKNEILKTNNLICGEYLENIHDIRKFPTIKRCFSRGRWAARVHDTIFDFSFHIYPLLTNIFFKYMYNSSVDSIKNQEMAFEIIKRSYPALLNIPLFNHQFPQNQIPFIENKIPGKLNYKNVYLVKYFDFIKHFILENFNLIDDLVTKQFVEELTVKKVENNAKISQIIYNILQTIIFFKIPDFEMLNNDLKINYNFEDEQFEDTYDEDCIKAFVEYNKDIVNLKKENNALQEKIDALVNKLEELKK